MDVFVYYEHREFLLEAVMITTNKTTIHQLLVTKQPLQ